MNKIWYWENKQDEFLHKILKYFNDAVKTLKITDIIIINTYSYKQYFFK